MKYKEQIVGASFTRKAFSEPKMGHYGMIKEKEFMFILKNCT
jgi:hypothetical protein